MVLPSQTNANRRQIQLCCLLSKPVSLPVKWDVTAWFPALLWPLVHIICLIQCLVKAINGVSRSNFLHFYFNLDLSKYSSFKEDDKAWEPSYILKVSLAFCTSFGEQWKNMLWCYLGWKSRIYGLYFLKEHCLLLYKGANKNKSFMSSLLSSLESKNLYRRGFKSNLVSKSMWQDETPHSVWSLHLQKGLCLDMLGA